jgi:hypothetical protein
MKTEINESDKKPAEAAMLEANDGSKPKWKPGQSYAIIGVALFALLELILSLLYYNAPNSLKFDPVKSANQSWVWWNVHDFRQLTKAPDVVLLGSSLMMAPLHGGDATYLNVGQNVALHHHSVLFEDLLHEKFGKKYQSFAFALGGEMVSDADVISETLLRADRKPNVIIYGIAPRDFMDHALPSAASTEIFKYMNRIGDLSAIEKQSYGSFWERAEHELTKLSFVYKHRPDFLYIQHRWAKELARKLGYTDLENEHAPLHIRKQAFLELPENHGPASLFVDAPNPGPEPFDLNLDEYRFRYRKINLKQFNSQVSFLERLLKYCQSEHIALILVNMPLTQDNLALMPPGFYSNYMSKVRALGAKYSADLLDLNDPTLFPNIHFRDSVHLNSRGGKYFFEVLVNKLAQDKKASAILEKSGH